MHTNNCSMSLPSKQVLTQGKFEEVIKRILVAQENPLNPFRAIQQILNTNLYDQNGVRIIEWDKVELRGEIFHVVCIDGHFHLYHQRNGLILCYLSEVAHKVKVVGGRYRSRSENTNAPYWVRSPEVMGSIITYKPTRPDLQKTRIIF